MLPPILKTGKLLARLAMIGVTLARSRRSAVGGFRRGLADMGVPPDAIDELSAAYPDIKLPGLRDHGA